MKKEAISIFFKGLVRSYSQIFFSQNYWFAVPLIIVSFIDFSAGCTGLLSVASANIAATFLNFDKYTTSKGFYGFNSLLVGLGLGYYYQLTLSIVIIAIIAGFLTFLITIVLQGVLGKYYLPYFSLPFVLCVWMVFSVGRQLSDVSMNHSGVYILNQIFAIGGQSFVNIHDWWTANVSSDYLNSYFISLGAIFFQFNVVAGIVVAIALFFYSRIAFLLSVIGYSVAYLAYYIIGIDLNLLGYSYIGFNFILGAIAIGGYYYIPSKRSFFWAIAITPVIAFVTAGLLGILAPLYLPLLSLPFTITLLIFIYSFRFRTKQSKFQEVIIQEGRPEKNLYSYQSFTNRFPNFGWFQIKLPFYGEWYVSQGHNGEHTHKGDWTSAWDFIITDKEGKQYRNNGDVVTDYYCFGQNIIAPADGMVVVVEDGIEDNNIGKVNTGKNWGNTVVIKHVDGLYSKLSHLKKDSITVKEGENVYYGTVLGKVGNSGRSPYPHLHFQLQSTPYIGSKTLKFPLFAYVEEGKVVKTFDYPTCGQKISSIVSEDLLRTSLDLTSGTKMFWNVSQNNIVSKLEWEVCTDLYNKTYIQCVNSKSIAYFINDGVYFYFTHFEGDKKSLLYNFYLACFRLPLTCIDGYISTDYLPVNKMFKGLRLFIHDIIAPFYIYLKSKLSVKVYRLGSEFDTTGFKYSSIIIGKSFNRKVLSKDYSLIINKDRSLNLTDNLSRMEATCEPY